MSYILDALKKAEAQRKLGTVPSIHSDASGRVPIIAGPHAGISRLWAVPAAVLLVAGVLAWFAPWQAALPPPVKILPQEQPAPPQVAAVQAAAAVVKPSVETRPANDMSAEKPVEKPVDKPAPLPAAAPAERSAKTEPLPSKPIREIKADKPPTPIAAAPASPPKKEPPMLHELPENIQREMPALTIGGYLYAANPSARSIVINNKFLREGDEAAPGIILETLLPKEAVLSYRGYRYRLSYSQNTPGR